MTPYGRPVGVGRTTVEAIGRLSKRIPPGKSGLSHERSNGNGSLMRIIPVPLYFHREEDERVVEIAHEVSAITHAHPRSLMACGIYSVFVLHLMREGDRSLAYRSAVGFLDNYCRAVFPDELDHFRRILSGELYKLTEDDIHSFGYVVDSLEACIWCFLNSEGFEEALECAIRLGGDTDTIGALTGGLSGLWWGFDSIPRDWVSGLASKELVLSVAERFCGFTSRG